MNRFKNILCIIENMNSCSDALERAVSLAENNQANLTVAFVTQPAFSIKSVIEAGLDPDTLQEAILLDHNTKLQDLIEPYRKRASIETNVLQGTPFLQIIRKVLRDGHDLVIKSPEDPEWLDRLFGSDDMHLLRKCPCPVWLIKPGKPKSRRRILAAIDLDVNQEESAIKADAHHALNRQILEMAASLALSEFAELHIIHVWDVYGDELMQGAFIKMTPEKIAAYIEMEKRQHKTALDKLLRESSPGFNQETLDHLTLETHLIKGYARTEIPDFAKRIDAELIVMGTLARTGIPGFLMGNTAEAILNQINCSVLAIKPSGFVTPVTLEE